MFGVFSQLVGRKWGPLGKGSSRAGLEGGRVPGSLTASHLGRPLPPHLHSLLQSLHIFISRGYFSWRQTIIPQLKARPPIMKTAKGTTKRRPSRSPLCVKTTGAGSFRGLAGACEDRPGARAQGACALATLCPRAAAAVAAAAQARPCFLSPIGKRRQVFPSAAATSPNGFSVSGLSGN